MGQSNSTEEAGSRASAELTAAQKGAQSLAQTSSHAFLASIPPEPLVGSAFPLLCPVPNFIPLYYRVSVQGEVTYRCRDLGIRKSLCQALECAHPAIPEAPITGR